MIGAIFNIIAPVAIVILFGYLAVKLKFFPKEGVPYITKFVHSFSVPLLLFNAVRQIDFAEQYDPKILAGYFLPLLLVFAIGIFSARKFGKGPQASVVLAFCAIFANSVYIGLPVSERAFGADSLMTNFIILSVHAPFCYVLGAISIQIARPEAIKWSSIARNIGADLVRNPLIIGTFLGATVNLLGVEFPVVLDDAITMLARAALPVALFGLGGVLTGLKVKGEVLPIATIVTLRMALHPTLVLLFTLYVFQLDLNIVKSMVLIAAIPTGTNGFIFAALYKREEELAASIVFVATLLSLFTLPIWLLIINQL